MEAFSEDGCIGISRKNAEQLLQAEAASLDELMGSLLLGEEDDEEEHPDEIAIDEIEELTNHNN